MTSKSPVRSCEDVDETALSYAEIKALCSGNPLIKEKIDLDIEVARLRLLKSEHQSQHYRLEDDLLKYYPETIKATQERIAGLEKDIQRWEANKPNVPETPPATAEPVEASGDGEAKPEAAKAPFAPMTVLGVVHTEKEAAGKALLEACKSVTGKDPVKVGSYLGFDMSISFNSLYKKFSLTLKGDLSHSVEMGADTFGNLTRIHHSLGEMDGYLTSNRTQLENLYQQMADAKAELQKPFAQETELSDRETRLALVNAELNIDGGRDAPEAGEPDLQQAVNAKNAKPSILEGLRMYGAEKKNGGPDKAKNNEITM